ncbi:hypothetical protein LWI29_027447 [Acer saccharum]|uniref:Uncharacterized protein n=1 Tax=Acer saccharum TaxID=4024 RepID=A0AA39VYC8_ACESA|nr:hypothetical protein LWI29_027447 [Acer saccharum]
MVYAKVPAAYLSDVQAVHEQSKRDQFLMKLRPEFEITRSNLMNRDPSPSLDVCFGELLREEQRLLTQAMFQQDSNPNPIAYAAYGKGKGKDMREVQCFSCKDYSHIAANCAKKSCDYWLQGNGTTSFKSWLIDSAASNHMTRSSNTLRNVRRYHGSSQIQIANGSHLAINEVGDINPSFRDVYVSLGLSTSLISVGQLVDNNCDVHSLLMVVLCRIKCRGRYLRRGLNTSHKGYVCYDHCSDKFRISRNVVFFENQYFFSTHVKSLPKISILPCFDELTPLPERFKPGIVYTRRLSTLPLTETDLSSEPVPITSPEINLPYETVPISSPMPLEPSPRRSARHVLLLGIFLNQHKYTQDLINLASLQDSSSMDTPMKVNVKYRSEEGDLLSDPTVFRQLVAT